MFGLIVNKWGILTESNKLARQTPLLSDDWCFNFRSSISSVKYVCIQTLPSFVDQIKKRVRICMKALHKCFYLFLA